jgi:MFS family permease
VTHRRDLGLLAAAALVSAAGDLAAVSALAVHLQRETGSGIAVAALFVANWLALALGAPSGGALADRLDARKLLVIASLAQATVAVALAATTTTAGVLALVALLGAGAAVAVPAEFALVGAIAAKGGGAGAVNARVETARNLGYALGPLAGAGCAAAAGIGAALLLDAASFAFVAVAALALRVRRRPVLGASKPRARDGIALITRDRTLRIAVAVLVGSLVAMSASISADIFFAAGLGHGSWGLGLLLMCWTTGMTAGSLAAAPRIPPRLLAPAAVAAAGAQGAGKLGAAAIGLLLPALLFYALGGAAHGMKNVAARTLIHERVHESAHGRAFAAYAALRNGAELAALAFGGILVDATGGRGTLALSGAATVAVAALGLAVLFSPRKGCANRWPLTSTSVSRLDTISTAGSSQASTR